MKRTRTIWGVVAMAALAVSLVACGGGGSGGTVADTSTPVISKGVMMKGSTIVNGVRFEDTTANITGDDTAKTPADLQDGMVVEVRGRRNDDGVTGTAQEIEIENEVRGTVTSVGTGTFGVLSQTVIVTSATVTAGGWSYTASTGAINGLIVSDFVEVHGSRNAAGDIIASRVEKFGVAGDDELRGVVTGLTPTPFVAGTSTFNIGALAIVTTGLTTADIFPSGAVVQEGTLVEVHLAGGNTATRIEVEDAEDAEFEPAEGQEVEFEGYVSSYDNVSDFEIDGRHVHLTGSTRYERGVYADIVDDVKIEVEGHMSGGVLIAHKVKFEDSIRIEADATSLSPLTALGLAVYPIASTEFPNGPVVLNEGVQVRGYLNQDGSITATRIDALGSPVAADKRFLQGPVSAYDAGAQTIVIAGLTIDLSAVPLVELKDDNDVSFGSKAEFYAAITLDRTVVKVRLKTGLQADKAEIE